jgi:hypothetical protein
MANPDQNPESTISSNIGSWRDDPAYQARKAAQREAYEEERKAMEAKVSASEARRAEPVSSRGFLDEMMRMMEHRLLHHHPGLDIRVGTPSIVGYSREEDFDIPDEEFLRQVRKILPAPAKIYYPACGDDDILEGVFQRGEIFYLDERPSLRRPGSLFVRGDYSQPPFLDSVFDAILYRDNHSSMDEFRIMLRSLKPQGLVIRDVFTCQDEIEPEEMEEMPELRKLDAPYEHYNFRVFRKL